MATLGKMVACEMNPHIKDVNPCCRKKLCLAAGMSCHSSSSSCPLVTGIGNHLTNMDRMLYVPCCSRAWSLISSITAFTTYSFKSPAKWENQEYNLWPLEDRVTFLSRLGTPTGRITGRLEQMVPSIEPERLARLINITNTVAPASTFGKATDIIKKCIRDVKKGQCCQKSLGSNSLTMLRHPFLRAVSAFYYRGHNPNYDVFMLRPGAWFRAGAHVPKGMKAFDFEYFTNAPEYQNVMTGMFGNSKGCDKVRKCHRNMGDRELNIRDPTCLLTTTCHAYRNTSMGDESLTQAKFALDHHRFFGLVEAYGSSLLLLAHTFGLTLDKSHFAPQRPSFKDRCQELRSRKIKVNRTLCEASMRANLLDTKLYEYVHREFCHRLEDAGLMENTMVIKEMQESKLCGDIDFSDPDEFCGIMASPAQVTKYHEDAAECQREQAAKEAERRRQRQTHH
uniref:Sulfotransferase n=1 Tax=Rhizochromulina marina TaxID=1034831 RepID=A0A7S2WAB1_9STRA